MSYNIRDGRYLVHQHYENGKKIQIYVGAFENGRLMPYPDGVEKSSDFEYRKAFIHLQKVKLLRQGNNPADYYLDEEEYEEWKTQQQVTIANQVMKIDASRRKSSNTRNNRPCGKTSYDCNTQN
jgi:hypothetical protein